MQGLCTHDFGDDLSLWPHFHFVGCSVCRMSAMLHKRTGSEPIDEVEAAAIRRELERFPSVHVSRVAYSILLG
jgi:hypothetical protein